MLGVLKRNISAVRGKLSSESTKVKESRPEVRLRRSSEGPDHVFKLQFPDSRRVWDVLQSFVYSDLLKPTNEELRGDDEV